MRAREGAEVREDRTAVALRCASRVAVPSASSVWMTSVRLCRSIPENNIGMLRRGDCIHVRRVDLVWNINYTANCPCDGLEPLSGTISPGCLWSGA